MPCCVCCVCASCVIIVFCVCATEKQREVGQGRGGKERRGQKDKQKVILCFLSLFLRERTREVALGELLSTLHWSLIGLKVRCEEWMSEWVSG